NVLVTGYTRSGNFPLVNASKSLLNGINGDDFDAFVAKLDPNGSKLLYSTFLGGPLDDGAAGIAVDAAGDAYVAVSVGSAAGFPGTTNAPDQFGIVVVIFESGHCHAGLWSGRHGPCHGLQDLSRQFEEDLRNHAGRQRPGGRDGDRGEQRGRGLRGGEHVVGGFPAGASVREHAGRASALEERR